MISWKGRGWKRRLQSPWKARCWCPGRANIPTCRSFWRLKGPLYSFSSQILSYFHNLKVLASTVSGCSRDLGKASVCFCAHLSSISLLLCSKKGVVRIDPFQQLATTFLSSSFSPYPQFASSPNHMSPFNSLSSIAELQPPALSSATELSPPETASSDFPSAPSSPSAMRC